MARLRVCTTVEASSFMSECCCVDGLISGINYSNTWSNAHSYALQERNLVFTFINKKTSAIFYLAKCSSKNKPNVLIQPYKIVSLAQKQQFVKSVFTYNFKISCFVLCL